MSEIIPAHSRRTFLSTSAAAATAAAIGGSAGLFPAQSAAAAERGTSFGAPTDRRVRPFRVRFPEKDLIDLRRRIVATRFPERRLSRISRRVCSLRP